MKQNRYKIGWLCILMFWGYISALAQTEVFPPRPEPAIYVNDYAGWLNAQQKYNLEQQLKAMHDTTSTQIVLMIRPDIGDYDRSSYAIELGNRWGIGKSGKDNGVVMLIVTEGRQRGAFISTGYGLEGSLPDVVASRIVRQKMIPYFQQERYFEGVQAGIDAVRSAVHGEFDASSEPIDTKATMISLFLFLGVICLFLFLMFKFGSRGRMIASTGGYDDVDNPNIPRRRLPSSRGGRTIYWGGGWGSGSGGGNWGGGSGGGGWGGGSFGGGSFGGGGGGGSW